MKEILEKAIARKQKTLSEYESKQILEKASIAIARQGLAQTKKEAEELAEKIGYPLVLKGCSDTLTHKTEMGMVKLNVKDASELSFAYDELTSEDIEMDGVLVMEMISGDREFVIGLIRDPQFGPCVMFGLGGIFTEALEDVSFRVAPLEMFDAEDMISEIKAQKLLENFRGKPAVDRKALKDILVRVGQLGVENDEIAEIDINPIVICGEKPVAVDALIVLNDAMHI